MNHHEGLCHIVEDPILINAQAVLGVGEFTEALDAALALLCGLVPQVFLHRVGNLRRIEFPQGVHVRSHRLEGPLPRAARLEVAGETRARLADDLGEEPVVLRPGGSLEFADPLAREMQRVEPAESPTLTTGHKVGRHRIQGISDEFVPPLLKLDELDSVIAVNDGDAILMAQKLAAQLGLAVGISSGANFLAALRAQERLGAGAVVATVFCDDNKKYLSTDLLRDEPVRPDYLSSDVQLTDYESYKRVCATCLEDDCVLRDKE